MGVPPAPTTTGATAGGDANAPNDATAADLAALHRQVEDLKAQVDALASKDDRAPSASTPTLQLSGMASFNAVGDIEQDGRAFHEAGGAAFGNMDTFFLSTVSDDVSFLAELVFEVGENGELSFDLERVLLVVEVAPWLHLDFGRGHLATSIWNRRFHHGEWLETPTSRPPFFEFEDHGGLVPAHYVGVDAHGDVELPGVRLSYSAASRPTPT